MALSVDDFAGLENHNFVRVHKTLRMSPAIAPGIESRLGSMEDVARLIERHDDLRSGALLVG